MYSLKIGSLLFWATLYKFADNYVGRPNKKAENGYWSAVLSGKEFIIIIVVVVVAAAAVVTRWRADDTEGKMPYVL